MKLFFAIPPEKSGSANYESFNSILDVCMHAGEMGYTRIPVTHARIDDARNGIAGKFLEMTDDPRDLLVMIDVDHRLPIDILTAMADHDPELGVIAALAYRRGAPYDPLFYFRDGAGLHAPAGTFQRGPIYQCAAVTTSAIAIRRWVFERIMARGFKPPFFRFEYDEVTGSCPSEDIYFSKLCELSGIPVYCDTGIEIPHATIGWVDSAVHDAYEAAWPTPAIDLTASMTV